MDFSHSFPLEWMSLMFGFIRDKGTNQKSQNMLTTSFGHSIRRNQHCINLRSRLGSAASFVLNQLQKYNIRDKAFIALWPGVQCEKKATDCEIDVRPHLLVISPGCLTRMTWRIWPTMSLTSASWPTITQTPSDQVLTVPCLGLESVLRYGH